MAEKTIYMTMFLLCKLVTSYYGIFYEKNHYMVFKMAKNKCQVEIFILISKLT